MATEKNGHSNGALEEEHPNGKDGTGEATIRLNGGTKLTNGLTPSSTPPPAALLAAERPRPHRSSTASTPPPFMVSAPGKVILFGEHAVVHGKAAMAAALSLRSYLLVTPLPRPSRTLTLRFSDVELEHTWDIDSLPWDKFSAPGKKRYYFDSIERLDKHLMDAIKPLVAAIPGRSQQMAVTPFLYLFLMLGSQHNSGAIYTMRSTLPIGAGLGSSASIAVCLSAALQLQNGTLAMPFDGMLPHETQLQLQRVNNWAFAGEMCLHGNPSGVDNTVSTGGKAVLYKRTDYSEPPEVTHLQSFPELPLLLVNTKHPRRTAEQVANVHNLLNDHPEITQAMLGTIDNVTMEAHSIINDPEFSSHTGSSFLKRLGDLIRVNHGLLVSLGVSHPKLERIREIIDYSGIGWTKLTGAGGGGCSITLVKPNTKPNVISELEEKLREAGFEKYETTIGGPGVGVLWPATIKKGDHIYDITPDLFLEAGGAEGVENLVGISGTGKDSGWKFWQDWSAETVDQ